MAEPSRAPAPQLDSGFRYPVPDPTALTTEQLLKAVAALRELLEAKLSGLTSTVDTRLDAMDKALELFREYTDRSPERIDSKVKGLQCLMDEKFNTIRETFTGIEKQFMERDTRVEQSNSATKTAVDAALSAAEKAVGKTEIAFTKQFDAITDLIRQMTKSMDDKIDPVRERVSLIENRQIALESRKEGSGDQTKSTMAFVALAISAGVAILAVIAFVAK